MHHQHRGTLDIVAPGAIVTAPPLGGGTANVAGTSMAAPHVAGAVAQMLEANPSLTVSDIKFRITSSPTLVADPGVPSQIFPRLDVAQAISDADGDSVADASDNCPLDPNSNQLDQESDGVGDACDNCTVLANGPAAGPNNQLDTDGDAIGNVCDCDFDNDGFCTIADFNLFLPDFQNTVDSGIGSDMDGSGAVGIADFNLFLPGFQAGEPGPPCPLPGCP